MSKRIHIRANANDDDQIEFWEGTILQGTLRMENYVFWFSRRINDGGKYEYREILNNSFEKFDIGDKRYDRAFFIDYVVERGTLYQAGSMTVIYKEGPFGYSQQVAGDDCGISFGFSVDENKIVLTATLTGSTSAGTLKLTTKTIGK